MTVEAQLKVGPLPLTPLGPSPLSNQKPGLGRRPKIEIISFSVICAIVFRNNFTGEYIPEDRLWLHGNNTSNTSSPPYMVSQFLNHILKSRFTTIQNMIHSSSKMQQGRKVPFDAE